MDNGILLLQTNGVIGSTLSVFRTKHEQQPNNSTDGWRGPGSNPGWSMNDTNSKPNNI